MFRSSSVGWWEAVLQQRIETYAVKSVTSAYTQQVDRGL